MSADDTATAPPSAPDKGQAPKPAATFSSFINKNTTGKKFAPKAARRRPVATATTPVPSIPEVVPEGPAPDPQPSVLSAPTQLLTPAATQLPNPTLPVPVPGGVANNPIVLSQSIPSTTETQLPPAPSARDAPPQGGVHAPTTANTPPSTDPVVDLSQPAKETQTVETEIPCSGSGISSEVAEATAVQFSDGSLPQLPSRNQRRLSRGVINHVQDGGPVEDVTALPSRNCRQANEDADADANHTDQQDDNTEPRVSRESISTKVRGKRKATTSAGGGANQAAPKRARKPKKSKPINTTERTETEGGDSQPIENAKSITARRKPCQPKRRKKNAADNEGGEGESSNPKRKGRPPREATPSDAEDQTIDPDQTYMDSLASGNIRVGKLSNREKEMRKVDWAAVRERRREEDSRPIQSKQEQEAADKALAEASAALDVQQVESGPRFREVDGRIEMIPDSGTINREADADRQIAEYEVIEDQDITVRITSRSFLKNNKRFPNDFILPGQGRRWNSESTDLFYQGLKSFGTDFQMISQMFPGSTRRSIKTKFTREERENPERVRQALHGQSEIISHWDVFLEASQRKEESFVDAEKIKQQLAEDAAIMREKIEAAKLETEERNRQRIAAGVLDEDGDEAGGKENHKGKKKRDKGKQVTFHEEAGLEIIGTLDDDDTWGQE